MSGAILAQAALMRSKGLLPADDDDEGRPPTLRDAANSRLSHQRANTAGTGKSHGVSSGNNEKGRRALWEYAYDPALGAEQFAHAKEHIRRLTEEIAEQKSAVVLAQAVMDSRRDLIDLVRSTILNDSVLLISDLSLREEYKERFKTILDSEELMGLHKAGLELEYRTRIEKLEAELRRNATDEAAREKAVEAREVQMEELRNERNAALTQTQQAKKQLAQLQEQFSVLRQNYRDANERFREHSKSSHLLGNEVQALQRLVKSQKSEIEDLNLQLAELRDELESGDGAHSFKRSLAGLASETTNALKRQCDAMLQTIFTTPGTAHMSNLTAFADSYHAAHRARKAEADREREKALNGGGVESPQQQQLLSVSSSTGNDGSAANVLPVSGTVARGGRGGGVNSSNMTPQERIDMSLAEGVGKDHRMARTLRDVAARMKPTVEKLTDETKKALASAVEAANEAAVNAARLQKQQHVESTSPSGGGGNSFTLTSSSQSAAHHRASVVEMPKSSIGDVTASLHLLLEFALDALIGSHERESELIRANKETKDRYDQHIAVLSLALERAAKEMQSLEALVGKANPMLDVGGGGGSSSTSLPTASSPLGKTATFADDVRRGGGAAAGSGGGQSAVVLLSAAPTALKETIKALKMEVADKAALLPQGGGASVATSPSSPQLAVGSSGGASNVGTTSVVGKDRLSASTMLTRPSSGGDGANKGNNSNSAAVTFDPLTPPEAWPAPSEAMQLAFSNAEALLASFGLVLGTVATHQSRTALMARRTSFAKEGASAAHAASQRRRQSLFSGGVGGLGMGGMSQQADPAVELTRVLMDLEQKTVLAAGGTTHLLQLITSEREGKKTARRSSSSNSSSWGHNENDDAESNDQSTNRLVLRSSSSIFRAFNPSMMGHVAKASQELGQDIRSLVAKHSPESVTTVAPNHNSAGARGNNNANTTYLSDDGGLPPLVPMAKHVESLAMVVLALTKLLKDGCTTLGGAADANDRLLEELDRIEAERDTLREDLAQLKRKSGSAGSTPSKASAVLLENTNQKAKSGGLFGDQEGGAEVDTTSPRGIGKKQKSGGARIFTRAVYCQTDIDATAFDRDGLYGGGGGGKSDDDDEEEEEEEEATAPPPVTMDVLNTFKFGDAEVEAPSQKGKKKVVTGGAKAKDKRQGDAVSLQKDQPLPSPPAKQPAKKATQSLQGGNMAAPKPSAAKLSGSTTGKSLSTKPTLNLSNSINSTKKKEGVPTESTIDSYEAADGTVGHLEPPTPEGAASGQQRGGGGADSTMISKSQHYLLMLEARKKFEEEMLERLAANKRDAAVGAGGGTRPSSAISVRSIPSFVSAGNVRRLSSVGSVNTNPPTAASDSNTINNKGAGETVADASRDEELAANKMKLAALQDELEEVRLLLESSDLALASAEVRAANSEQTLEDMAGEANQASKRIQGLEDCLAQRALRGGESATTGEQGTSCGSVVHLSYTYVQTDCDGQHVRANDLVSFPLEDDSGMKHAQLSGVKASYAPQLAPLQRPILSSNSLFNYSSRPPSAKGSRQLTSGSPHLATQTLELVVASSSTHTESTSLPQSARNLNGASSFGQLRGVHARRGVNERDATDFYDNDGASHPLLTSIMTAAPDHATQGEAALQSASAAHAPPSLIEPKASEGRHNPARVHTTVTNLSNPRPSSPHRGLGLIAGGSKRVSSMHVNRPASANNATAKSISSSTVASTSHASRVAPTRSSASGQRGGSSAAVVGTVRSAVVSVGAASRAVTSNHDDSLERLNATPIRKNEKNEKFVAEDAHSRLPFTPSRVNSPSSSRIPSPEGGKTATLFLFDESAVPHDNSVPDVPLYFGPPHGETTLIRHSHPPAKDALGMFDPDAEAKLYAAGPRPYIPPYPSHHPALRSESASAMACFGEAQSTVSKIHDGDGAASSFIDESGVNATKHRVSSASATTTRFRPSTAGVPSARIYTVRDRGEKGGRVGAKEQQRNKGAEASMVRSEGYEVAHDNTRVEPRPSSPIRLASDIDALDSGRSVTNHMHVTGGGGVDAVVAISGSGRPQSSSGVGSQFLSRRLSFLRSSPDRLRFRTGMGAPTILTERLVGLKRNDVPLSSANDAEGRPNVTALNTSGQLQIPPYARALYKLPEQNEESPPVAPEELSYAAVATVKEVTHNDSSPLTRVGVGGKSSVAARSRAGRQAVAAAASSFSLAPRASMK